MMSIIVSPPTSPTTNISIELGNLDKSKDQEKMMEYIKSLGVGMRPINDPFFEEGDKICGVYTRVGIVDEDEEDLCHNVMKTFQCDVPNCQLEFDNLLKYDLHYNSCHRYSCSECKKQLPSPHLLDLHISETHDSFFKAASERKPMFKCFVEDCSVVSLTPKDRRSHCIEDHKFPHDFKFDSARKLPKKKTEKSKKLNGGPSEIKNKPAGSSGPFTFGHKKTGKTFITKYKKIEKPIEMHELMESLPSVDDQPK
ncbi:zinc finger protein 511 [Halyomorpha halys]|uniref:zinc finger protein 511 n=1 Tax=Halyomorpha halys TaxID=286706 RepID=UPI0006D4E792|nr:zinc finger protein 511 isoform X2 [Halyomorpha halys]